MIKELIKISNKLDLIGLTKEADELDGIIRKMAGSPIADKDVHNERVDYTVCPSEKPNFDEGALKKLFLDFAKKWFNDDFGVKVYDATAKLEWGDFDKNNCPHYKFFVVTHDPLDPDPVLEEFVFWLVSRDFGDSTVTVKDKEGKEHHFYGEY